MADLKLHNVMDVDSKKYQWDYAVVYAVFGKGAVEGTQKVESMAIYDETGNIEGHNEGRKNKSDYQKTEKVNLIKIFRV